MLHSMLEYNISPSGKSRKAKHAGQSSTSRAAAMSGVSGTSTISASTWTLESPYMERRVGGCEGQALRLQDGPPSHLVLHLMKVPSLEVRGVSCMPWLICVVCVSHGLSVPVLAS